MGFAHWAFLLATILFTYGFPAVPQGALTPDVTDAPVLAPEFTPAEKSVLHDALSYFYEHLFSPDVLHCYESQQQGAYASVKEDYLYNYKELLVGAGDAFPPALDNGGKSLLASQLKILREGVLIKFQFKFPSLQLLAFEEADTEISKADVGTLFPLPSQLKGRVTLYVNRNVLKGDARKLRYQPAELAGAFVHELAHALGHNHAGRGMPSYPHFQIALLQQCLSSKGTYQRPQAPQGDPNGPLAKNQYVGAQALKKFSDEERNLLGRSLQVFYQRMFSKRVGDCLEAAAKVRAYGWVDEQYALDYLKGWGRPNDDYYKKKPWTLVSDQWKSLHHWILVEQHFPLPKIQLSHFEMTPTEIERLTKENRNRTAKEQHWVPQDFTAWVEPNTLFLAPYEMRGEIKILVNRHYLKDPQWQDPEIWASIFAHQFFHLMGNRHPGRNNEHFQEYQINAIESCVRSDGQWKLLLH